MYNCHYCWLNNYNHYIIVYWLSFILNPPKTETNQKIIFKIKNEISEI